jgi:group I intron endonuclease
MAYYSTANFLRNDYIIQKAIIKHGHNNFSLYILEYCEVQDLISREQYYMDMLSPQYNINPVAGSLLGFKHSEETRLKMSLTKEGLYLGENNPMFGKTGEDCPMFGKTHSLESRLKITLSKTGVKRTQETKAKLGKKVFVYSIENSPNTLLYEFISYNEAAQQLKCIRRTITQYIDTGRIYRKKWILTSNKIPSSSGKI